MNLIKRVQKLEEEAGASTQQMLLHWQFTENTQHLRCVGHEFTREPGESLGNFVNRAAVALDIIPGNVLWLDATSTI